jgi:ribosomal protein S24E
MTSEFGKFDATMKKLLSVSHEELQRREKEWKLNRAKKKHAGAQRKTGNGKP